MNIKKNMFKNKELNLYENIKEDSTKCYSLINMFKVYFKYTLLIVTMIIVIFTYLTIQIFNYKYDNAFNINEILNNKGNHLFIGIYIFLFFACFIVINHYKKSKYILLISQSFLIISIFLDTYYIHLSDIPQNLYLLLITLKYLSIYSYLLGCIATFYFCIDNKDKISNWLVGKSAKKLDIDKDYYNSILNMFNYYYMNDKNKFNELNMIFKSIDNIEDLIKVKNTKYYDDFINIKK